MALDIVRVLGALRSDVQFLRTLEHILIERDTISWGSNSATARCRVMGMEGTFLLKCYFRHRRNARAIYGDRFYPQEFGVAGFRGRMEYADIALLDWIEGTPLETLLWREDADYKALSEAFDRLALRTLKSDGAHGDIKPENIIVKPDGEMELIDWDAAWRPGMSSYDAEEIGTFAYRHPLRDDTNFNKHIDDYPIALISTTLAALAIDSEAMLKFRNAENCIIHPEDAIQGKDPAVRHAIELFEQVGDAAHYRIAQILESIFTSNISLPDYIFHASQPRPTSVPSSATLAKEWHLYGLRAGNKWVVPPLYDWVDEPKNGVCRLTLGDHFFEIGVVDAKECSEADGEAEANPSELPL